MISIRQATLSDYQSLLAFEQGIIRAERPFDPTLDDDPIRYYDIKEMLTAPHIHLVVAEIENKIVGCGYARIEEAKPYLRHCKYSHLGFMYTEPQFRGQGINYKIMEALEKWSVEKGILEMRLEVYSGNTAAQMAYQKADFVSHMIIMRRELLPPADLPVGREEGRGAKSSGRD